MRIDPCYAPILAIPDAALRPPLHDQSIADYRAAIEPALAATIGPRVDRVEDIDADGVPLRLYRPSNAAGLGVVLYFHGGCFTLCSLDTHDALCRELALKSGAAVVAVDYRRAPEHRYPAAEEDGIRALDWVTAHAALLDLDATRIGLCGDSAGAHIAIGVALRAAGTALATRHLALIYPMIDPAVGSASAIALADGPILTGAMLRWAWQVYLGSHADPLADAPLAKLPATTLITAEWDPLRDEGEAFGDDLRAAGGVVTARRYLGMAHGFCSMPTLTPVAARAIGDVGADIALALAT